MGMFEEEVAKEKLGEEKSAAVQKKADDQKKVADELFKKNDPWDTSKLSRNIGAGYTGPTATRTSMTESMGGGGLVGAPMMQTTLFSNRLPSRNVTGDRDMVKLALGGPFNPNNVTKNRGNFGIG
jgi:hypothetical protein